MLHTYKTKEDFLNAISGKMDSAVAPGDVRSALISGISSADDALRGSDDRKSLALNLKVGSWVIRDDDLPLFQALNTTGAAIALTLTTGGLALPAAVAAVSSFAELCWRVWRRGARLSAPQVAVYGFLQAHGPMKREDLLSHIKTESGGPMSMDVLTATLESLAGVDVADGHILALASKDSNDVWKALRI